MGAQKAETREAAQAWSNRAAAWENRAEFIRSTSTSVAEWLIDRLEPRAGQTILELAAGPGDTGFLAAKRMGDSGRLISSDVSPDMLEVAKRRGQGLSNVEFRVLDATDTGLETSSIDGVLCRWGFMVMPDPAAAVNEVNRVLKPGGHLVFSVWGSPAVNPWATIPRNALVELGHTEPVPPTKPGSIFSLSDHQRIIGLVLQAGFQPPEIEEIECNWGFDTFESLWGFYTELSTGAEVLAQITDQAARAAVKDAMLRGAEPYESNGSYELPGMAINAATTKSA